MPDRIYLIDDQQRLHPLQGTMYQSEDLLQTFLTDYPDLLAGDQMDPDSPRRWLLVQREMGVAATVDGGDRWSLDHLFLDQDGVPTLVEVKRSTDTRIRREVVAQMLDYAANAVVHWPVEKIQASFEQTCKMAGKSADEVVASFLVSGTDGDEPAVGSPEIFWGRVKTNLEAERIRLVFVADQIPPELQRIVEFLNGQMRSAEVVAVELKQYVGEGIRTLVPRVLGRTAGAQQAKGQANRRRWSEAEVVAEVEATSGPAVGGAAREILEWARKWTVRIWPGKGLKVGSFVPALEMQGKPVPLFVVQTDGMITLNFAVLANKTCFADRDLREALRQRLNEIEGMDIKPHEIDGYLRRRLELLTGPGALDSFKRTFQWVVERVQAAAAGT